MGMSLSFAKKTTCHGEVYPCYGMMLCTLTNAVITAERDDYFPSPRFGAGVE
jgi:hypothetical protein